MRLRNKVYACAGAAVLALTLTGVATAASEPAPSCASALAAYNTAVVPLDGLQKKLDDAQREVTNATVALAIVEAPEKPELASVEAAKKRLATAVTSRDEAQKAYNEARATADKAKATADRVCAGTPGQPGKPGEAGKPGTPGAGAKPSEPGKVTVKPAPAPRIITERDAQLPAVTG